MSFLKKLFSNKKADAKIAEDRWYVAQQGEMRQVVMELAPVPTAQGSELASLGLVGDNQRFLKSPAIAGVLQLDNKPKPRILVRLDSLSARLATEQMRIAFSFFRTKYGGITALYVEAPAIDEHLQMPFLEGIFGLDTPSTLRRLHQLFDSNRLAITLAEQGGMFEQIEAKADRYFDLSKGCGKRLLAEYSELNEYHRANYQTNFVEANRAVEGIIAPDEHPILRD